MEDLPFRRHRSWIEVLGILVALSAALGLMKSLLESVWTFILVPFPEAWRLFVLTWQQNFLGAAVVVLGVATLPRWLPQHRLARWTGLALAVIAAGVVGWVVQDSFVRVANGAPIPPEERGYELHSSLMLAVLVAALGEYHWRSLRAAAAVHEAGLTRIRLQGELAAGRLQVLQAQVEPHFLFNSLANARRLLRTDGEAGRGMLADLMRYLESALPRMRDDRSNLAREAELIRAFLAVHQIRMGPRLQVSIAVPAELGGRVVPPMMLLTLIENALKHGVGPLPEGGAIAVGAHETDGRLVLRVADTGRGLVAGSGGGTGLANIRARLRAMYGAGARLSLRLNEPRGVVAEIALPAQAA